LLKSRLSSSSPASISWATISSCLGRNARIRVEDLVVSIIVPCYNEEEVIEESAGRIAAIMKHIPCRNYEIIFINDGSQDKTLSILKTIACANEHVRVLAFSRNFGHQPAVTAGLRHCTGDVAIIIDADLQDSPELFPDLLARYVENGSNVIYCVRQERKGETLFKRLTANLFYKLLNRLSDVELPLDSGDFRLVDRKVINTFNTLPERNKYIRGLISWIGYQQGPFYYVREPRFAGTTKYSLMKMMKFAATSLLYFTIKPLHLAIGIGACAILVGLFMSVYVLFARLSGLISTVPGWSSVMILIIFFGGVQLFSVGIVAEYMASLFDEVKKRPEYIIDE
jgi:glycosyltransferase involved in cell wall biosynthesis